MRILTYLAGYLIGLLTRSDSKPRYDEDKDNKKPPIPKKLRQEVWIKYHGDCDKGVCYCCGKNIDRYMKHIDGKYQGGWHCSHVLAHDKGGINSLDNLRTCCQHCNLSMGNCNLYAYIKQKNLNGPGRKNMAKYFRQNPSQINDKRTNNWGK